MIAKAVCKKSIGFISGIVSYAVLAIIMLLIAFAEYALWDTNQIHRAADKSHYEVYKPSKADGGKSFKELQAINDEVFAWLTVYGTNIDYPVAHNEDNMKYVNTNAEGQYSLSGAIFLDSSNSKDFSDFNSILYGHHMAKKTMFGEIGEFSDRAVFEARRYGNLYYDEKDHGIEFFAFVHVDAYDMAVFRANAKDETRQGYLDNLIEKSMYFRDIGVSTEDRIILLSTCSSSSTNGRDILVGRITDETYEWFVPDDVDIVKKQTPADFMYCTLQEIPTAKLLSPMLVLVLAALLIVKAVGVHLGSKQKTKPKTE